MVTGSEGPRLARVVDLLLNKHSVIVEQRLRRIVQPPRRQILQRKH